MTAEIGPDTIEAAQRRYSAHVLELSKMTRGQLEAEERRAMAAVNTRRLDKNRMSKDELINSILYFEAQR